MDLHRPLTGTFFPGGNTPFHRAVCGPCLQGISWEILSVVVGATILTATMRYQSWLRRALLRDSVWASCREAVLPAAAIWLMPESGSLLLEQANEAFESS